MTVRSDGGNMDLYRIIGDLVTERNRLQRIIESLEAVDSVPAKSRPAPRGRKTMDGAARQEVSERMKLYWSKRRAEMAARKSAGSQSEA